MIPILQMRKGLEGQKLQSNLDVSDFRAGVLTLMLHREGNGKYGRFLVDRVSFCKDENEITYLDLRGPPRGRYQHLEILCTVTG